MNNVQTAEKVEKARFFFSGNVPVTTETISKIASATAVGIRKMLGTLKADFLKHQSDVSKSTFFSSLPAAEAAKMVQYPDKLWEATTISYVFSDRNISRGRWFWSVFSRSSDFMLKLQHWENPRPQPPKKRRTKKKSEEPSLPKPARKRMIEKNGAESSSSPAQKKRKTEKDRAQSSSSATQKEVPRRDVIGRPQI